MSDIVGFNERRLALIESTKFYAARRASGLTLDDAANACGISRPSYISRESAPGTFRLEEVHNLYECMNEDGRLLVREGLKDLFFCDCDCV